MAYYHCDIEELASTERPFLRIAKYNEDSLSMAYVHLFNEKNDKARYDAVVDVKFNDIALCVGGQPLGGSLDGLDYAAGARKYLTDAGMTDAEVDQLIARLTKK